VKVFGLVVVLALAACGGSPASSGSTRETVTVLAAASLTESFTRIGQDFEADNPDTKVTFSFAGSSQLAQQINSGAPADVFASASTDTMTLADGEPAVFARNQLVIAVPKGNPMGVSGLADLTALKVALCAEQVPCGAAAKKALDAAGVSLTPVTLEQDVKAALSKVKLGEVDAALVYRTDAAGDVEGIEFPESARAINDYPIAALKDAPNPSGARAFVDYVLSDKAQRVLAEAGFQRP
jgi:molybdate transport system substrate-binding protein